MSTEEKKAIQVPVNIPAELAVPGAQFDLQNGRVMELLTVTEEAIEWKEIPHPGVEEAAGLFKKAGKDPSDSVEDIVEGLILLAATSPNMTQKDLWPYLVQAFPVQVTTIVTRAQLGIARPVEKANGAGASVSGDQQLVINLRPQINVPEAKKQAPPVINFNPQINVPKQDAPIVNVNPKLEMPPQREQREVTTIERDSNGFIQSATKVRQPIG